MTRFLTCTAVGLFLGLAPAMAESQLPADNSQNPPAVEEPAQPSEAMPAEPSDPAAPVPDASSEAPDKSSQIAPQAEPATPDAASPEASPPPQSSEAQPVEPAAPGAASPPPQSSEAPQSILPAAPSATASASGQFLDKQASDDWLASNLIGKSVVNSQDESIGEITDLVTDQSGKIVAVLIGNGGFLGIGQKDVALRFEDIKLARDENNDVKVIANLSQETLASAPDFETLDEQQVTVGSNKSDREDTGEQKY